MKSEELKNQDYKYGFTTEIENYKAPKGLSEKTITFISKVKKLNQEKKDYEAKMHSKIKKTGADQEVADVDEAGPGFAHDCAAKVVHEKYGKGDCIPEKHTLVKEGSKYVVTHYDVLFESGKTVKNIPVNELDIKTSNEHWHKGYKKKSKD